MAIEAMVSIAGLVLFVLRVKSIQAVQEVIFNLLIFLLAPILLAVAAVAGEAFDVDA